MTVKGDAKFKGKQLTCGLKNDIENLVNFYEKIQKRCFMALKSDAKFE